LQKLIDGYISQNKVKRDQGKHKQQMQKKDMHQALLEAGYEIGYTTVCRYARLVEQRGKEVFIRQHYEPGQCVEFDWGEVKLTINGKEKRLMLAVFTSCYSNHRWARLYYRQDMSSFSHAHVCYFAYVGHVCQQLVYDNMRVAVRKFTLRNADKEPTEALLKMSCYYQFDYRFCNAGKGNEKGHVERSVEVVRRKAFCIKDKFDHLEAANDHVLQTCVKLDQLPITGKTKTIQELFEQELQHMKVAPSAYDTAELSNLRVDKYSCIKVDTNWYSVPEGFVGQRMDVKIYPSRIRIYNPDNQCIATHERTHTRFEYYLNLDHYLETLRTKPGALRGSLSLFQADIGLRQIFLQHFEKSPRDFIELLLFARQHKYGIVHIQKAIDKCIRCCPQHPVSLDKLKILLSQKQIEPVIEPPTQELSKSIAKHCQKQLQDIQSLI
ncbi:MAG: IS21 family transposase, partial [Hyphomicrobiales bacterium]|nr:IS21 family transposase [Hyphomicrobiales bacterium]